MVKTLNVLTCNIGEKHLNLYKLVSAQTMQCLNINFNK